MMLTQETNRRSEELTKALKEAEATFEIQIKELKRENALLKVMIAKPM